jgi:hypothetical protein
LTLTSVDTSHLSYVSTRSFVVVAFGCRSSEPSAVAAFCSVSPRGLVRGAVAFGCAARPGPPDNRAVRAGLAREASLARRANWTGVQTAAKRCARLNVVVQPSRHGARGQIKCMSCGNELDASGMWGFQGRVRRQRRRAWVIANRSVRSRTSPAGLRGRENQPAHSVGADHYAELRAILVLSSALSLSRSEWTSA